MSSHHISIWSRSSNKLRQSEIRLECFCLSGLSIAALVLFLVNLANLPLLDPNEATLAQVAKEIYQSTATFNWVFPTLWGEPYLAQPPLVHNLVAIAYSIGGVNEFTTRFPGALLGAVSVILIYNIGREIFIARIPALFSALVYLTCLPVVRYSRLATLDGPLLCFELVTIWAVLRSRRDVRWALVTGIGLSLISLTNGLFGCQILLISLLFLLWDTPRLVTSAYFWTGLILGAIPGVVWYVAQWFRYHEFKTTKDLIELFLAQTVSTSVELGLPVGYNLLQGLQYFLPWIIVGFTSLTVIQQNFHWGWGKLLAVWIGGYLILGFLVIHQDFWLVLPVYPALALAAGRQLDQIANLPSYVAYPRSWMYGFALMAVMAALAGLNWGIRNYIDFYLPFVCGSLSITFAATAIVIAQQDKQFIPLLFWGLFISFFLLFISPHWIWELKAVESVKPIAELVKQYTPPQAIIYSSMPLERPSLDFYSDRQIVNQSIEELKQHWQENATVYLLVDSLALKQLNLPQQAIAKDAQFESLGWMLAIKKPKSILAGQLR
ncbi:MAG TPA: glycosyltransferase family 39 protein [Coleofasciculaceae cyanobacterium]|jgi:4-amino-4-deoxy-L-arabinose transferase-like glycosyltransferase